MRCLCLASICTHVLMHYRSCCTILATIVAVLDSANCPFSVKEEIRNLFSLSEHFVPMHEQEVVTADVVF